MAIMDYFLLPYLLLATSSTLNFQKLIASNHREENMIDLTEQFFTEIYPKYREIARSINDDKVLNKDITGNCAVLSVRGKSNVRSLSKLISSK